MALEPTAAVWLDEVSYAEVMKHWEIETEMTASQQKIIGMMGEECISRIIGGMDTASQQPVKSAIHPESIVVTPDQLISEVQKFFE